MSLIRRFCTDTQGTVSIEYAIIASLVAVVIVGAVTSVGSNTKSKFEAVASNFK